MLRRILNANKFAAQAFKRNNVSLFKNSVRLNSGAAGSPNSGLGDVMGIDLGTTNSCVALMNGSTPVVIENSEGKRTTPSIIAFDKNGTRYVGEPAKRQAVMNPENTFHATKRLIGRRYEEVKDYKVTYKITPGPNGDAWVESQGKKYSPSQMGAFILMKMKETASTYAGKEIKNAVITVPAYFNDAQRQATKDAGRIAGLNVLRIINEPTAAAISYGMDKSDAKTIAVYDLGGGTFDISIIDIAGGVFEVKSTNGDTFLGGEDFDNAILQHFVEEFKKKEGIDLSNDRLAMQRLREAAEKVKKDLDHTEKCDIELPWICQGKHFNIRFTKEQFEKLVDPLVKRSMEPCANALRDAGLTVRDINEVILVGGMTRTPMVVKRVREYFGKEPCKGVNPDEAVAIGAAIQGGVLVGDVKDLVLLDVTPLSLGVDTSGDIFARVINRNTPIPATATKTFTTVQDMQTEIHFDILQGERDIASANKVLGHVRLSGLMPAARGVPKIDVQFTIDVNGIVHVSAKDRASGREEKVTVKTSGGLSEAEIEAMIRDAEAQNAKDQKRIQLAQLKNEVETAMFTAEKNLNSFRGKVPEADIKAIEKQIDDLRMLTETAEEPEQLKNAMDALNKSVMKAGEAFYTASANNNKQQQDQQQQQQQQ